METFKIVMIVLAAAFAAWLGFNVYKRWWRTFFASITIVMAICAIGLNSALTSFKVSGHSMDSTLFNGESLVGLRRNWQPFGINTNIHLFTPQRDDIVIAHANRKIPGTNRTINEDIVKRVIGLPKDRIDINNNQVYLNNEPLKEYYRKNGNIYLNSTGQEDNKVLPKYFINEKMTMNNTVNGKSIAAILNKHQVFLMGDNRNFSTDSRVFGPFDTNTELIAKILPINLPLPLYAISWIMFAIGFLSLGAWWMLDRNDEKKKSNKQVKTF